MITIIAAIGKNNEIGLNNDLLWRLPEDLKRFKRLTTGNAIIMGRKTYESIGRALPNRTNIVVTKNKAFEAKGCLVVNSLEEALKACDSEMCFIIGGASIYEQAFPLADKLELTLVDFEGKADTFFPKIDYSKWVLSKKESHKTVDKHAYDFQFNTYLKK
jgi:dihydrofolate reductase